MNAQDQPWLSMNPATTGPRIVPRLEGAGVDGVVATAQVVGRHVVGDRRDRRLEQRLAEGEDPVEGEHAERGRGRAGRPGR